MFTHPSCDEHRAAPKVETTYMITKTAEDLERAIALTEQQFPADHKLEDYRLVQARRLMAGGPKCKTLRCWHLTFKLVNLIPTSANAFIGGGGEIFFVTDVGADTVELVGFGE